MRAKDINVEWDIVTGVLNMLYTANVKDIKNIEKKIKIYYLLIDKGNDEVVPDKMDLDSYKKGLITYLGFRLNYLFKIMKPKANEWMKKVSLEAVSEDVVLVDEESNPEHSYRKLLAEMMDNMFTGNLNFKYKGELVMVKQQ